MKIKDLKDIRDEIKNYKPGQRITQMSREDFTETVRFFLIDKPDFDKLCQSTRKKDRTLARKICMIMCMDPQSTTALLADADWTRVEFTSAYGGGIDMRALNEDWDGVRR